MKGRWKKVKRWGGDCWIRKQQRGSEKRRQEGKIPWSQQLQSCEQGLGFAGSGSRNERFRSRRRYLNYFAKGLNLPCVVY